MKKIFLSLLLFASVNCFASEQKFIAITAKISGYNEINEIPAVNELLRQGWKIISFSGAGTGNSSGSTSNIFILLERN